MEPNRILVLCDFSLTSNAALAHAVKMAQRDGGELHLLHVIAEGVSPLALRPAAGSDAHQRAYEELQRMIPPQLGLKVSPVFAVRQGKPVQEVLQYATDRQIQLIVMGTHGRTGVIQMALGSVAEKIVRSSSCPVLVIPRDRRDDNLLLRQAAEVLAREFGESFYGERASTEAQLKERIERLVEVDMLRAERILQELTEQGTLTWTPPADSHGTSKGQWRIGAPPRMITMPAVLTGVESAPALDLLQRAWSVRASDIHLDPWSQNEYLVRFRIDGSLEKYCRVDSDIASRLIHQFKMLGNLDIADPFHPQEGRLRIPASLGNKEVRITTSPAAGGEAVALRLFSLDSVFRELGQLGLSEQSLRDVTGMLRRGEGIVLITGPTGSGKTTTVYSMLAEFGDGSRNIVSIEDPVEYPVPFVRQMAVDERHNITMTSGLRTILRMDPDVVFVGEIRDVEAAEIGMRAASSGKYVFTTLHTRDVASTVTAVRDLRIDNRSLAGNLNGIINQRLVRLLCPYCRTSSEITDGERAIFRQNGMEPPGSLARPQGCVRCRERGYLGRTGVFEVAIIDESIAAAISQAASEMELRQLLRTKGTISLATDALRKVADGSMSLNEALEVSWI